jgi:hypothetical protein
VGILRLVKCDRAIWGGHFFKPQGRALGAAGIVKLPELLNAFTNR